MTRQSSRLARVADHVQRELLDIIRGQMRDPRIGILSISEVRISRDLSYADVYVSMLEAESAEDRETLLAVLDNASGYLRSLLAARSKLRITPQLRFHYDEMLERGAELERLIDRAVAQDQAQKGAPQPGARQPGARQPEGEE